MPKSIIPKGSKLAKEGAMFMRWGFGFLEQKEVRCFFKKHSNDKAEFEMQGTNVPSNCGEGSTMVPVSSAKTAEWV